MNLLQTLLSDSNLKSLSTAANSLGLGEQQTKSLLAGLVPALAKGVQRNSASADGLQSLLSALSKGDHQRYLSDPGALAASAGIEDGNKILGHVLGSKDVSRQIAQRAAQQAGVDYGAAKQFLPMVAAAVMGALGKQGQGGRQGAASAQAGGFNAGALTSFLDADGDGSVADDLLGMAKKFLR